MTIEQMLQNGGLVAVCGMLIYLLREQGKRMIESNATWLELGKVVERLSGGVERLTMTVERIEQRLDESTVCPVTQVTSEALREAVRAGGQPQDRRKVDRLITSAVKAAIRGEGGDAQ